MGCDFTAGSNTVQDESDSRSNSVKPHLDYPGECRKAHQRETKGGF